MDTPVLYYFADPMCSWCWGFTPVLEQIKQTYEPRLRIGLIMGGLRPGVKEPMKSEQRQEILHHWHQVHEMTGQSFRFEGALPDGFIYDTEPASRGVVAMGELAPGHVLAYFSRVQSAFYLDQLDVTSEAVLAGLASELGVEGDVFSETFAQAQTREKTLAHFQWARQAGVQGFPTLVLKAHDQLYLLSRGYRPFPELAVALESHLQH